MKKKYICLLLAVVMLMGIFAGCSSTTPAASDSTTAPGNTPSESTAAEIVKQAPVLQAQVDAGTLPDLTDRIPVESDVYVEAGNNPTETPSYGGTTTAASGTSDPLPKSLCSGCWTTVPWSPTWQRAMRCPTMASFTPFISARA